MTKRKIHKKSYYSITFSIKKILYFHLGLGNIHHLASQFIAHSHSCGLWYTVVGTQSRRVINYLSMLDRDPHMQVALQHATQ